MFGAWVAYRQLFRALFVHSGAHTFTIFTHDLDKATRDLATLSEAAAGRVQLQHLSRLPAALSSGECDLLHAPSSHLHLLAQLRQRYAPRLIPITTSIITSLSYHQFFPDFVSELWAALQPYDCLVFSSQAIRQTWEQMIGGVAAKLQRPLPLARHEVIPLGVDTARYRPGDRAAARAALGLPAEGLLALSLARLSPYDKADLVPVLMAFEREIVRRPELPQLCLLIAGYDEYLGYSKTLQQFINLRGLGARVQLLPSPAAELVPTLYAAADLFVAPYDCLQENFGQTPVEAMAAGLPVVAADWGPLRETVVPQETGLLVPTCWAPCLQAISDLAPYLGRNGQLYLDQSVAVDVAALWRAVADLAGDEARRRQMGEQARRRVLERYDWPVVIAGYERLWEQLAEEALRVAAPPVFTTESPLSLDYFAAYRHYPRTLLDEASEVRLTATGWEHLQQMNLLIPLPDMLPVISFTLLSALANACREWISLARLLAEQPLLLERQRRVYHVLWLIKYGLLEYRDGGL